MTYVRMSLPSELKHQEASSRNILFAFLSLQAQKVLWFFKNETETSYKTETRNIYVWI